MLKNAIGLFVITVIILLVFLPSYTQMQDLKQRNQTYAVRIKELEAKNARLEREKHMLETDPEYVEKVGREKMGLIRPGEKVYKMAPPATKKR
jgi:cell division protein FtsB